MRVAAALEVAISPWGESRPPHVMAHSHASGAMARPVSGPREDEWRWEQLEQLSKSLLCVPVISGAAVAPLTALDPSRGLDWCVLAICARMCIAHICKECACARAWHMRIHRCDPLLLEWSLALEFHAAGRLSVAPLLIGQVPTMHVHARTTHGMHTHYE